MLHRDELDGIAEIARRNDLLVISDEIYERLVYGDHEHVAIASLPGMRERTIHIGGFSKSYAMTGWRIGYVCAPAGLMANRQDPPVRDHVRAAPAQYAAIEAVRSGEPFVQSMHEEYERRRVLMTRRFNEMGLTCFEPMGAFYCFPNVRDATGLDDEQFAQELLREEHVAVVPAAPSVHPAPGTSAPATPPPTRRSSRPWIAQRFVERRRARGRLRVSDPATPAASAIFDATADDYAATMAPSLRPVAAEVVRRAALQPGERVLDVGCGTGSRPPLRTLPAPRWWASDGAPR